LTVSVADALSQWASGVTLVTISDGRDDIGVTVSAFLSVSLEPPLVAVALDSSSYVVEALGPSFALTVLATEQRVLAGRFSASGRPGARLMLEDVPHVRGPQSGALIPSGGLCALECSVRQVVEAGDHLVVVGSVENVVYVAESGAPLLRHAGRYHSLM
jgi:flavin reductase (DIM6/NTAB) family NADH-FMN oxidoreductase RutF